MINTEQLYYLMSLPSIGSVASIIGLVLTIFIYFGVRKIRRDFLFRARIPALLKKLQKHASKLSRCLQDYSNTKEATDEELSIAEVNLVSLYQKSYGPLKKSLKSLIKDIRRFRKDDSRSTKQNLRSIYLNINMVVQEINNLREDEKWGATNGR